VLCALFNLILASGKVPLLFGSGVVIPVPKDKSSDLGSSKIYRAIIVSPVISKVFEMCLFRIIS